MSGNAERAGRPWDEEAESAILRKEGGDSAGKTQLESREKQLTLEWTRKELEVGDSWESERRTCEEGMSTQEWMATQNTAGCVVRVQTQVGTLSVDFKLFETQGLC